MKEIRLPELLNMADPAAHDGICDLWNQKAIHFLVVFTSPDQDFEIIGAGPTLPYATMEAAAAHLIPNKKPEFFVKCPAAIAGRLQPKLAPGVTRPIIPLSKLSSPLPSLKGRTIAPFMRPALKLPPKPVSGAAPEVAAPAPTPIPAAAPDSPATNPVPTAPLVTLEERERAIARREQELAMLAASLKIREAALRDREAALTASEERLLNPPPAAD
jgi:hypothetical protein